MTSRRIRQGLILLGAYISINALGLGCFSAMDTHPLVHDGCPQDASQTRRTALRINKMLYSRSKEQKFRFDCYGVLRINKTVMISQGRGV